MFVSKKLVQQQFGPLRFEELQSPSRKIRRTFYHILNPLLQFPNIHYPKRKTPASTRSSEAICTNSMTYHVCQHKISYSASSTLFCNRFWAIVVFLLSSQPSSPTVLNTPNQEVQIDIESWDNVQLNYYTCSLQPQHFFIWTGHVMPQIHFCPF